jgi:hypothetical protein
MRKVWLVNTQTDTAAAAAAADAEGGDGQGQGQDEFGFSSAPVAKIRENDDEGEGEGEGEAEAHTSVDQRACFAPLPPRRNNIAVSVGEVSFHALKAALIAAGVATESVTAATPDGAVSTMLVCERQVFVKRSGENDFEVEGPPVAAFWATRKVLYAHFAFLQS